MERRGQITQPDRFMSARVNKPPDLCRSVAVGGVDLADFIDPLKDPLTEGGGQAGQAVNAIGSQRCQIVPSVNDGRGELVRSRLSLSLIVAEPSEKENEGDAAVPRDGNDNLLDSFPAESHVRSR